MGLRDKRRSRPQCGHRSAVRTVVSVPRVNPSAAARSERIESIDHLRVVAALTVLFGHAVHALHETNAFAGHQLGFFRQGIGPMVFLAIAGFVAAHGARDEFGVKGAGLRYLGKRLVRLVPLYWLFTGLFVAVVLVAPSLVDHGGLDLQHAIGSFAFWPVPRPGDGRMRPLLNPGWVLVYIVWFHAWFALCMTQRRRLGLTVCVAGLFALSMLGSALPHSGAWSYFASRHVAVLGLGVLCALLHRSIARHVSLPVVPAFLAVAALFALAWANSKSEGDWPTIVCAIGIVVVASLARGFREGSAFARLWGTLARASYSIYLSQAFTLAAFAVVADRSGALAHVPFAIALIGLMAWSLACGVLCHRIVEQPLHRALTAWGGRELGHSAAKSRIALDAHVGRSSMTEALGRGATPR